MFFKFLGNSKFSLLLIFLSFTLIISQNERCTSILHCYYCPDIKRCETCETGFKLAVELDRCIPENEPYNLNITIPQENSPGPLSSNNAQNQLNSSSGGSLQNCTNITSNISSSNISVVSKPPVASNAPVASNNPTASNAQNANQGLSPLESEKSSGGSSLKKCICLVVIILVICIIYIFIRKKKGKASYFYDESGNPDEKAKVVSIK